MLKQCGDGGDLRFLSLSPGRSAGEAVGGRETGQTYQMFPLLSGFCTQQALGGKGDCPVLFLAEGGSRCSFYCCIFSQQTPGTRLVHDVLPAFRKNMETFPVGGWRLST